ncbi:hypothetical protein PINS_up022792 [Pythium insidiosum]|nr:hypothetical protein PINS_up022792 [Pythium insidiosum]
MSGLIAVDNVCMRAPLMTTQCRNVEGVPVSLCIQQKSANLTCLIREECRIMDPAPVHVSCRKMNLFLVPNLPATLQSLDLGENVIWYFRPEFPQNGPPPQLKRVSLEKTELSGMENVYLPPSTEELSLDGTRIVDLVFHDNLLSLRKLSVRDSQLSTIDGVQLPPKLEILDVERSKIETLVLHNGLANLRVLKLDGNPISAIDVRTRNLRLQELTISLPDLLMLKDLPSSVTDLSVSTTAAEWTKFSAPAQLLRL